MNILYIAEILLLALLSNSFATNLGPSLSGTYDSRGNRDGLYLEESEGSAAWPKRNRFEGNTYQSGNGAFGDDEDEDSDHDSSGAGAPIINGRDLTVCERLHKEVSDKRNLGAYIPRCTNRGEFFAVQCLESAGFCWCVTNDGAEIPGSRVKGQLSNCDTFDRNRIYPSESLPERMLPPTTKLPPPYFSGGVSKEPVRPGEEKIRIDIMSSTPKAPVTSDGTYKGDKLTKDGPAWSQPFVLAGIIGGAVVGLLCAVLLVMFIVYRMRKKDEGSYSLEEKKYHQVPNKEYYA